VRQPAPFVTRWRSRTVANGDSSRILPPYMRRSPKVAPPLPLFASGTPVCVINQFAASSVQGMANIQTGAFDSTATPILLDWVVVSSK